MPALPVIQPNNHCLRVLEAMDAPFPRILLLAPQSGWRVALHPCVYTVCLLQMPHPCINTLLYLATLNDIYFFDLTPVFKCAYFGGSFTLSTWSVFTLAFRFVCVLYVYTPWLIDTCFSLNSTKAIWKKDKKKKAGRFTLLPRKWINK